MIWQLLHLGWIGAARVQHGTAAPVYGARVVTVQRDDVVGSAGRILEVHVREGLPTTAEADDLDVVLTAAICHALDDCVEAGNVAAARENADAFLARPIPSAIMHNVTFFTRSLPACGLRAAENAPAVRTRCRGSHHTPARNGQHRGARPALAAHLLCVMMIAMSSPVWRTKPSMSRPFCRSPSRPRPRQSPSYVQTASYSR